MKLKKNYELKNLQGRLEVLYNDQPTGIVIDSVAMNDTAEVLWDLLKERDVTKTEMLETLITRFDISTVLALGNIDVFVRTLKENDIIEE